MDVLLHIVGNPLTDGGFCVDGLQQDQFGRSLPTFIQLLDLSDQEREDYQKVMVMVEQGEEVDQFVGNDSDKPSDMASSTSTTNRLNNKVIFSCCSILC